MLSLARVRQDGRPHRLLIIAVLLLAAALRLWGLDRDPPPYDVLPDAAPWTDEGTIGLPAVQAAQGVVSLATAISDGGRPVHRLILYATFKLIGTGRSQGRLVSVLFGMVGLAGLAAFSRRLWPGPGPLLALVLAGTGFFFVAYDRLLLTEGPLIALMTLLALVGTRIRSRPAALAVGVAAAVLTFGFKLHAIVLFPALGIYYALRRRSLLLPLIAGTAVTLLAWRLFFIPQAAPNYTAYLGDRFGGEVLGLVSPWQAVQQVGGAGLPAFFMPYQLPLLILACVEALAFVASPRAWLRAAPAAAIVGLTWLVGIIVGDSIFRYLPPRYFHLASPAMVLLAVAGARRIWQCIPFPRGLPLVQGLAGAASAAFILYQSLSALRIFGRPDVWLAASGVGLALAVFFALAYEGGLRRTLYAPVLAALLLGQLLTQGALYARGIAPSQPRLARAGAQLAATLPRDALVTGRLAGTVALSEPLHGAPALERIQLAGLEWLAQRYGPVWVLILQHDEYRVDRPVWPYLVKEAAFPIDYSSSQRVLYLYRFTAPAAALR